LPSGIFRCERQRNRVRITDWEGVEVRPMRFYLIVAKGSKKGMPIPITVDGAQNALGVFLIGSDEMCQLRKKSLSSKQCAIVFRDRKVFIQDLRDEQDNADTDSSPLNLVNDNAMSPGDEWPLHGGDRIAFGKLEFMIQYHEKPLSQRDLEEWASKCLDVSVERNLFDEGADEFHHANNASDAAQNIIDRLSAQRGVVMGRFRIGRENGVTIVRLTDSMLVEEAEIAFIKRELCDHLHRPNLRVLLDCKNVRRMSTLGAMMFREFHRWLQPFGSTMALCRVRADIRPILKTLDLDTIPLFMDKRSALLENW
jgi:anti-anti-sigma regulatory factor